MSRPLTLYHWTFDANARAIQADGFALSTRPDLTHGEGVYFSDGVLSYRRVDRNALFQVTVAPGTVDAVIVFDPDFPDVPGTTELWYCVKSLDLLADIRRII